MKKILSIIPLSLTVCVLSRNAQPVGLGRVEFLIGNWEGNGEGFGDDRKANKRYANT